MINELVDKDVIPYESFLPCELYINGDYWGIYWIKSRLNATYIAEAFNLNEEQIVFTKNKKLESTASTLSEAEVKALKELIHSLNNLNYSDEIYDAISKEIDIENLLNYYALEIYIANIDWPNNNYGMWKSLEKSNDGYGDGKWRFIVYDVDSAMLDENSDLDYRDISQKDNLFNFLIQNEEFYKELNIKIYNYSNNELSPDNVKAFISGYKKWMGDHIDNYYNLYYPDINVNDFYEECDKISAFFEERYKYVNERYGDIE